MTIKKYFPFIGAGVMLLVAMAYMQVTNAKFDKIKTADPHATRKTKALFANLQKHSGQQILFGQQDALAYGVTWREWHETRSDVNDVCGKQPALFGWDVSKLGQTPYNIDSVDFGHMKAWIVKTYEMGAVNSISWHMDNIANGKTSWDVGDRVVATILPGGEHHEAYKFKLDLFAEFVGDLQSGRLFKNDVPIVFRPFHEHTGSWFWWGRDFCSPEEYKAIWKFTQQYLTETKGVHNLLWCYSPDIFESREHYLECYPGDEYVDILGLDDYHDLGETGKTEDLLRRLRMLVELADEKGKVAALTETGQETIKNPSWFTKKLAGPIQSDPIASRISWMMVWRNDRPDHHYAPYPGHHSVPDFLTFSKKPGMIFQNEIPNMYTW